MKPDEHVQLITELINQRRYGAEYQPLIDCQTGEVVAYEALARFYGADGVSVPPLDMFRYLHESPLMLARVEQDLKQIQLSQRPAGKKLFINLDPDAYLGFGYGGPENPLISLIAQHDNLVVELIENTSVNDAVASQELISELMALGKQLALDDVGAPDSMVALPVLSTVDYIKFDRSWLARIDDENSLILLESLISYARRTGKTTVLEGIETEQQLQLALQLQIDLVQGFLYKQQFIEYRVS